MLALELIEQTNGNFLVKGDLTFFNLNKKTIPSMEFLNSAKIINIDLIKVNSADSAGLALMIEWIKHSKLYETKLSFKNIPHQLITLVKLCGLENNEYFQNLETYAE